MTAEPRPAKFIDNKEVGWAFNWCRKHSELLFETRDDCEAYRTKNYVELASNIYDIKSNQMQQT